MPYSEENEVYEVVPVENTGNGLQVFCDNVNNVGNSVSNVCNGIAAVGNIIVRMGDNKIRREEIRAQRDVEVAKIRSQTKILSESINGEFKEREKNFKVIHDMCDKALDNHDNEALGIALSAMCGMAENSVIKKISIGKFNAQENMTLPDRSQTLDI
jgi:hypothetical protein